MAVTGSNYLQVRQFYQGVNSSKRVARGSLPVLGPELDGSFLSQSAFGQPKTYSDNLGFQDLADYDPVSYINDVNGDQMFPAILGNLNIRDPESLDGIIEPLTIRSKASRNSIDHPYEAHDVFGTLMSGNEDTFKRTSIVNQFFEIEIPDTIVPFVDSDEYMGDTITAAVKIPGIVSSNTAILSPFDEQNEIEYDKLGVTLTGIDLIGAIGDMKPQTDDLLPNDHRSAGAGSTYNNNVAGTDSIAFGGLKK